MVISTWKQVLIINLKPACDYYSTGKVTTLLSRAPCHTPVQMNDFRIYENDDYK